MSVIRTCAVSNLVLLATAFKINGLEHLAAVPLAPIAVHPSSLQLCNGIKAGHFLQSLNKSSITFTVVVGRLSISS